jgi:hypothetical protein
MNPFAYSPRISRRAFLKFCAATTSDQVQLPESRRVLTRDPFGNRVELVLPSD